MSNGIDFVIGGKNQASAPMNAVEKSMQRLQAGTTKLKSATQGLMASMAPLLVVLAAVKTVMAAVGGIRSTNEAYDVQTESVKRLNAALQIRGAQGASAGMQQVAKDLEKLTGVSDQTTLGLMNQAQSMGFATSAMDDAAKAALGLAAATGKTTEQSLGDMKAALEGNFEAFHGLNPQIMFMRSNQEKLAAVMAIANQGLAQQSQDMGTVSGSGRRADTALTTLMETFGKIIAPIRVLINAGLNGLATSLSSILTPAAEYATAAMERMKPLVLLIAKYYSILTESIMTMGAALFEIATNAMQAVFGNAITEMIDALSNGSKAMDAFTQFSVMMMNAVISIFTAFEVVITNLSSVWELAKASAELAMVAIVESIKHTFTEVIPAYLMWFGENFINLIKDAFNGVITIIQNAGKIIGETVYQIFAFIASGGEGGIDGLMRELGHAAAIGLLDGFESSLTSLPDIAARQITQREQDLADKIGAIGGRLGEEFSDKMRERMLGVGDDLSGEISAATSNINLKGRQSVMTGGIAATEGRLLTRGPGTRLPDQMQQIIDLLRNPPAPRKENKILVQIDPAQMQTWEQIQQNTANTLQMEAIA
jgi:hypothetical protein